MNDDLSTTNVANIEMHNLENAIHNSILIASAENVAVSVNPDPTPPLPSSEAIATSSTSTLENVPPRYLITVTQRAVNSSLKESAFPPLPGVSENANGKSKASKMKVLSKVSRCNGSSSDEQADRHQGMPPLPEKLNLSSGEKWSCNACTLLNSQHRILCLVCGAERPDNRISLADFSISESSQNSSGGSVWGNGGGQRFPSVVQRSPVGDSTYNSKR